MDNFLKKYKKIKLKNLIKYNFLIIFAFSLLFIVYSFFLFNPNKSVPLIGNNHQFPYVRMNLKGNNTFVKLNNKNLNPMINFPYTDYKVYGFENYPVQKLEIKADESIISIDDKLLFFDKTNGEINIDNSYFKKNKKQFLKNIRFKILSMLYNSNIALLLCFSILLQLCRRKTKKYLIFYIILLACLLRLIDCPTSTWMDEMYALKYAGSNVLPFSSVLLDPGNPPLFFIIIKYFQKFISVNIDYIRLIPIFFSIYSVYLIYYLTKKYVGLKSALFASFLFCVNIYSIISAQEIRCYSMVYFISLLLTIYLFKLLKEENNKNFIVYSIFAIIIINLHYYGFIILLANFIYGIINIKNKKKFILANLFAIISFLPYLLITGIQKGLMDSNFNSNIPTNSLDTLLSAFTKLTCGKICAIILLLLGIRAFYKKNKFYSYNFFIIIFVFSFAFLFSYIKPIFRDYYFITILPYFIILFSYILKFKKLKYYILIIFLISYFNYKDYIPRQREKMPSFDNLIDFYLYDKNKDKTLVLPYYQDVIKVAYKLNQSAKTKEVSRLLNAQEFYDKIEQIDSKIIFFKLEHEIALPFLKLASKKYYTSFIRIKNDVILVRLEKINL